MLVVAVASFDIRFQVTSMLADTDLVVAILVGKVCHLGEEVELHTDLEVLVHATTTRKAVVTVTPFLAELTSVAIAMALSELVHTCNYHQFYFNHLCM